MTAVIDYRAQRLYAECLKKRGVPDHLHEGLLRYLVYGVLPGHFLRAVLNNDLAEAMKRGDPIALAGLDGLVAFLVHDAPYTAWGAPGKVLAWVDSFQNGVAHAR